MTGCAYHVTAYRGLTLKALQRVANPVTRWRFSNQNPWYKSPKGRPFGVRPKTLSSNEVRPKGPLENRSPSGRGAPAQWRTHVMSAQQPSSAKKVMKTSLRSGGCIGRPFPLSEGPILRLVAFPSFSSKANAPTFLRGRLFLPFTWTIHLSKKTRKNRGIAGRECATRTPTRVT